MKVNDGGPAFPRPVGYAEKRVREHQPFYNEPHDGMSLRDYFAGMALQGRQVSLFDSYEAGAKYCYEYADAMIAEREK